MPRRRRSKDRPSLEPSEEPPPDGDAGDAPGAAPAPAEGDGDRELSLDEAFGPGPLTTVCCRIEHILGMALIRRT